MPSAAQTREDVVGREAELGALERFIAPGQPSRTLVLSGGPGIGKTTLWEAGIRIAREGGRRVLVARPSDAEAQLAYAAAIDLLDGVDAEELASLSDPQRHALEVATLRVGAGGSPDPGAIAVAFLNLLRALSAREPLVVAVDDIQWLDPPSADALTFAARRLEDHDVRFLLAKRPGETLPLERARERQGLGLLEIGPLSLGAVRHLLSERLGLTVTRHVLRRLVELTRGNPLFALEIGRSVPDGHQLALGEDLPVPKTVEDLLGTRVERLPAAARSALLAVALHADLRVSELAAILDPLAPEEAVGAGIVIVDGERVRPSHPLIGESRRQADRGGATRRRAGGRRLVEQGDRPGHGRHRGDGRDAPLEGLCQARRPFPNAAGGSPFPAGVAAKDPRFPGFRRGHAGRSVGRVGEFIAELYVPRADQAGADGLSRRVRAAAEELTREGTPVRYLRSIFVPADETCFVLCEAPSAGAVCETAARASLRFARIAEAMTPVVDQEAHPCV